MLCTDKELHNFLSSTVEFLSNLESTPNEKHPEIEIKVPSVFKLKMLEKIITELSSVSEKVEMQKDQGMVLQHINLVDGDDYNWVLFKLIVSGKTDKNNVRRKMISTINKNYVCTSQFNVAFKIELEEDAIDLHYHVDVEKVKMIAICNPEFKQEVKMEKNVEMQKEKVVNKNDSFITIGSNTYKVKYKHSQSIDGQRYSIGYYVDNENKIIKAAISICSDRFQKSVARNIVNERLKANVNSDMCITIPHIQHLIENKLQSTLHYMHREFCEMMDFVPSEVMVKLEDKCVKTLDKSFNKMSNIIDINSFDITNISHRFIMDAVYKQFLSKNNKNINRVLSNVELDD